MYSRSNTIAKLVYGLDQLSCQQSIADILVTADAKQAYDGQQFNNRLTTFKNTALYRSFARGVTVITRSRSGRLHCHIAVDMSERCTSFDWLSFDESERYFNLYKKYGSKHDLSFYKYYTSKYRRSMPLSWQRANRRIMQLAKRHGLGRVYLTPIRKNLNAYKWYMVSNIPHRKDKRDSKLRYFNSWGMRRAGRLQVINKYTRSYRERVKLFAQGLQLSSENYSICLRSVLGRGWYFKIRDILADIHDHSPEQVLRYNTLKQSLEMHRLRGE